MIQTIQHSPARKHAQQQKAVTAQPQAEPASSPANTWQDDVVIAVGLIGGLVMIGMLTWLGHLYRQHQLRWKGRAWAEGVQQAQGAAGGMRYCPNCGAELRVGDRGEIQQTAPPPANFPN